MKTKWFQTLAAMALLAVVALFVSPVLAYGCCCGTSGAHAAGNAMAAHRAGEPEVERHACCSEEAGHEDGHAALGGKHQASNCATVEKVCNCTSPDSGISFIVSDGTGFSYAAAVAVPVRRQIEMGYVEDVRTAAYVQDSARPRSPSLSVAAGRAPPACS